MRKARCEVIDPAEVNIVHVCSRTVRRCFLFGKDPLTGKNYDHRKPWIEAKLKHFAGHFGIDLLCFSILSNHFHLVLRNRPDMVATWDDTEVARRWLMICPHRKDNEGRPLEPTEAELNTIRNCPVRLAELRRRLADISWWMRLLCQSIATRCNREDEAMGRFFEERYRATRLLDEASLVACCAYVDLNPIRAAISETIEGSDHTSIQRRVESLRSRSDREPAEPIRDRPDAFLSPVQVDEQNGRIGPCPSESPTRCSDRGFLPIDELTYVELLDWTARQNRPDKRGSSPQDLPPLVKRLDLEPTAWSELVSSFGRLFHHVAGRPKRVDAHRSHKTGGRFRMHPRARHLLASGVG